MTQTRKLGDADVFPIGLGGMPLSVTGRPDEDRAIRTIHAALDAGVNLIDTADAYSLGESDFGHNERLIAKALRGRRDGVLVATKGGHTRRGSRWELDGRPEHIRAACEASLRALGTDGIDLYQFHRPDPEVPYAESIGAFRDLHDEGKVRRVGVSNASVEQLEEARAIVEIVSVQNQLAPDFTSPIAKGELAYADAHGLAFLPWSPLGGIGRADGTGALSPVARAAEAHGVSPQRVVLAWLLALSPAVIPIPGSSRPETIADSARAVELELGEDEVRAISAAVGVGVDAG
jgi:aryl-alcohol dehydrogenase-like predicted oxidoreductase